MDKQTLKDYLQKYSTAALYSFAARRHIPYGGMSKNDVLNALLPVFQDPAILRRELQSLTKTEDFILRTISQNNGRMAAKEMERQLEANGERDAQWTIRGVMASGLVLYSPEEAENSPIRLDLFGSGQSYRTEHELWLPPAVAEEMKTAFAPPEPEEEAKLTPCAAVKTTRRFPFDQLIREIYTLVQALQARPLTFTRSGDFRKSDLNALNAQLPPPGFGSMEKTTRFNFLADILITVGVIKYRPEDAVSAAPNSARFFLLSPSEQLLALLNSWQEYPFGELQNTPGIFVINSRHPGFPSIARQMDARQFILENLRDAALKEWVTIDSFLRVLRRRKKDFLFAHEEDENPRKVYIYDGIIPEGNLGLRRGYFTKQDDWMRVEGGFIRTALTLPLLWLGIVEIGLDAEENAVAFRLTPAGAAALGLEGEATQEPAAAGAGLIVQPNFELMLLPDIAGFGAAVELDRFADRISVDRAILYRLTRESVYRGLRGGVGAQAMIERLEALSQAPLPQNVRHTLEDWGRRFAGLRLYHAATVVTADDEKELHKTLRGVSEQRVTHLSSLAVHVRDEAFVARRKKTTGVRWCDYSAAPPRVVHPEAGLRLRVPEAELTPLLRYRLEQLARPEEQLGEYRLDRERVQACVQSGTPLADLQAFLSQVTMQPLPPDFTLTLRAWGGAYQKVALSKAAALSGPPSLLDLLQTDSAIQPHILARASAGVLLLRPEGEETARRALAELNLTVSDSPAALHESATLPADAVRILTPAVIRKHLVRAIEEERSVLLLYLSPRTLRLSLVRVKPLSIAQRGSHFALAALADEETKVFIESRDIQGLGVADAADPV